MPDNVHRYPLKPQIQKWLAHFSCLVPWEPVESRESFVNVLTPCLTAKMGREILVALRKNRMENLEKRIIRWIELLCFG